MSQFDLFDALPEEPAPPEAGDVPVLLAALDQWVIDGWLRELDRSFALFLQQLDPRADVPLLLAATLASHQLGRGHVCLDLEAALAQQQLSLALPPESSARRDAPPGPEPWLRALSLSRWRAALLASPLCADGDVQGGAGATPLVLSGPRLYLRRYWQYEREVRQAIAQRLAPAPVATAQRIRPVLDALFGGAAEAGREDWQKMACALALRQRFAIVTGGPGTGKTTTVVRLLALLQSLAQGDEARGDAGGALRIQLAAPTGKAAARLSDSIRGALDRLPWERLPHGAAVRAQVPDQASTLHRLLGSRPDSRRLRHHAGHPLALDVLVVDEASMVDLEMMHALLQALPPHARLVLLGDKDQLASVEAGAVLGELCRRAEAGHYDADTVQWLQASSGQQPPAPLCDATQGQPLDQAVAMLRVSHRFHAGSGIGQLARAVNEGRAADARALLNQGLDDLRVCTLKTAPAAGQGDDALRQLVLADALPGAASPGPVGCAHYLRLMRDTRPAPQAPRAHWDAWAAQLLQAAGRFQLLAALREGPWGVNGLNLCVAELLHAAGWLQGTQGWFAGRPVLVTRNDHALGLMNGDVGLVLDRPARFVGDAPDALPDAQAGLARRVAFAAADGSGGVRWVLPARLSSVETVFAMTVHKSQGSEFEHTALVLPDQPNPVLTRELVYTGITRARRWFTLVANARGRAGVLEGAIARRVLRASGLVDDAR
ncbi:exodeoxyribonuclease V subunit alpha [Xenophilus arseniciresistens]|uniref:RecBCD enzyme subunit RecD n=1 Tax=Xenophilus arseniciresistens TaxID=1283306 RepID=A0AAE3NBC2_9BURK|nr:exodeoxyribonuclease V subunit alpha [Xenophilus arseniciresistens]MDA7418383.1 exodeoxyribonuclease V subunit alpha [Xenophilus arseniciresistens]